MTLDINDPNFDPKESYEAFKKWVDDTSRLKCRWPDHRFDYLNDEVQPSRSIYPWDISAWVVKIEYPNAAKTAKTLCRIWVISKYLIEVESPSEMYRLT